MAAARARAKPVATAERDASTQRRLLEMVQSRGHAAHALQMFLPLCASIAANRERARPDTSAAEPEAIGDAVVTLLLCAVRDYKLEVATEQLEAAISRYGVCTASERRNVPAAMSNESAKQWALVAAKTAQGVLKCYAGAAPDSSSGSEEDNAADTKAALALATAALSTVCRYEHLLRLGDLVVENILYQLTKKCMETRNCVKPGLRLFAVLHTRLWRMHHILNGTPHDELSSTSLSAMLQKDIDEQPQLQDVVACCSFPSPQSCHNVQYTRVIISVANIALNALLTAAGYEEILEVSRLTLGPWITHFCRMPGADPKLAGSYNDRVFRVLWKCAAAEETKHAKALTCDQSLAFRSVALAFMLKCPNYTTAYCIQQVHRVGVQKERRATQLRQPVPASLYVFYRDVADILAHKIPLPASSTSRSFDWEYINWLEHFASICESSKHHLQALVVLEYGIAYAYDIATSTGKIIGSSFQISFARLVLELRAAKIQDCNNGNGIEGQIKKSRFFNRMYTNRVKSILQSLRSPRCKQMCERIFQRCLKELGITTREFSVEKAWPDELVSMFIRTNRREMTRLYFLGLEDIESRSSFAKDIAASIAIISTFMHSIVSSKCINVEPHSESVISCATRCFRLTVSIASQACTSGAIDLICDDWISIMDQHITQFQLLLDEAIAQQHDSMSMMMKTLVTDIQAIARDCYSCASHYYKKREYGNVVRTLRSVFALAENYLEYVMCTDASTSSDNVDIAHTHLKMESIASLLAFSLREESEPTASRKYYGHAILYSSNPQSAISLGYTDKYATAVADEFRLICASSEDSFDSIVSTFVRNVSVAWGIRNVPESIIAMFRRELYQSFNRASAQLLSKMRPSAGTSGAEDAPTLDVIKMCTSVEKILYSAIVEKCGCDSLAKTAIGSICNALILRKLSFATYYCTGCVTKTLNGMHSAIDALTRAIDELNSAGSLPNARIDVGGAYGWRGVFLLEIKQIEGYEGANPHNRAKHTVDRPLIVARDPILDVRQCITLWNGGVVDFDNQPHGVFDNRWAEECLEAVSSALSLVSCASLEVQVRSLLALMKSTSANRSEVFPSPTPVPLLQQELTPILDKELKKPVMAEGASKEDAYSEGVRLDLSLIDAEAGLSLSFVHSGELALARAHLMNAKDMLVRNQDSAKLVQDLAVYKAIVMREIVILMVRCDLLCSSGLVKSAIAEAKTALSLCWRLSKKVGVTCGANNDDYRYELPSEIREAMYQRADTKSQLVYFKALEFSSWDVLLVTKLILCRIAAMYMRVNQPHRSSVYYSEAMELVGGLNIVGFRKRPFYEFAELQILAERTSHAAAVHQLVSSDSVNPMNIGKIMTSDSSDLIPNDPGYLMQHCDEIIQRGDLHILESRSVDGIKCYDEALQLLQRHQITTRGLAMTYARCCRRRTKAKLADLRPKSIESVNDLLVCLKDLKRATKRCTDLVEQLWCVCTLVKTSLVLIRSASTQGFLPAVKLVKLMEDAYLRGDHLGIAHLSREIRVTLGLSYLASHDSIAEYDGTDTERREKDGYMSWATAIMLGNYSTIEDISDVPSRQLCDVRSETKEDAERDSLNIQSYTRATIDKIQCLPVSWQMVSISIGPCSELALTLISVSGSDPISFYLGNLKWEECIREFHKIIDASRQTLTDQSGEDTDTWDSTRKKEWWNIRNSLDDQIETVLLQMQACLGFWRALLLFTPQAKYEHKTMDISAIIADDLSLPNLSRKSSCLLAAVIQSQVILSDEEIQHALDQVATEDNFSMSTERTMQLVQIIRGIANRDISSTSTITPAVGSGGGVDILSIEQLMKHKVVDLRERLLRLGMDTGGSKADLVQRIFDKQQKGMSSGDYGYKASGEEVSIILVLDDRLELFPWEGMDVFKMRAVSRMPSIELLLTNAERHLGVGDKNASHSGQICVDPTRVTYVLNPANDLPSTQQHLQPVFQQGIRDCEWKGVVGQIPDESTMSNFLLESDLFVYCGHGSGERYFHRDKILNLPGRCSSALLFGCSSGRLEREGIFGPHGAVLSYLRAGSPAVLAMLWDVTDRDIDRLSMDLLENWLLCNVSPGSSTASRELSLAVALQFSRRHCKLRFLNGLAPVCYGLPIYVNKSRRRPSKKQRRT